jgi:hypothetical protein
VPLALTIKALRVMELCLKARQSRRGNTLVDRGQEPLRGQGLVAAAHLAIYTHYGPYDPGSRGSGRVRGFFAQAGLRPMSSRRYPR